MLNGETAIWKEWLRQLFGAIDWALFSIFGALYEIFVDAALLEFVSDKIELYFRTFLPKAFSS